MLASAARRLVREIRRTAPPMVTMQDVEVAAALEGLEAELFKLGGSLPPASREFEEVVLELEAVKAAMVAKDDTPPPF